MRFPKVVGVLAGLALLTAACGSDDASSPAEPAATDAPDEPAGDAADAPAATDAPADPSEGTTDGTPDDASDETAGVDGGAGEVPSRIISLSPTHTEMLFAVGAGGQVVAVDEFSNHPPEAADVVTDLSGWAPNVEAIAAYEPDLVVTDGTNPDLLDQLDLLEIARWEGPAAVTFSDVYDQLEQLGALTGNVADAAALVASMQAEIDAITAGLPDVGRPLTYYHELDNTYFTVTSDTFIGHVYAQLGLRSIADLAEGSGGPYPQLNPEFIVSADPDLIIQACSVYCGETAETMASRPGWGDLSAVRNEMVLEVDDDVASRWGPRIVDYYRDVAAAVAQLAELEPAG